MTSSGNPICSTERSIFLSFGLLFHTKIISNYVEEELSYGELSLRNSDLIDENKDLVRENEMLVELMKAEKEKFENEMNIQQNKVNTEVQKSNDVQRNLQGWAPIIFSHWGSISFVPGFFERIYHCFKHNLLVGLLLRRPIRAILKDENFENIRFSLEERRNHVSLVCQNISYDTTFWEKKNGTDFVDVPSKLGFR